MKTKHLIPHQSVLCQDPRNIGRILKIMYCWEICLEALCSVLRSEPRPRHREARQRDYGKKIAGPVSVLGYDYHFKIEVGLPTCTGKCEDGSHSVLGNPRRGWRSVWVSVFKFHRKLQKYAETTSSQFNCLFANPHRLSEVEVGSMPEWLDRVLKRYTFRGVNDQWWLCSPYLTLAVAGPLFWNMCYMSLRYTAMVPLISFNMWKWWVALWLPLSRQIKLMAVSKKVEDIKGFTISSAVT